MRMRVRVYDSDGAILWNKFMITIRWYYLHRNLVERGMVVNGNDRHYRIVSLSLLSNDRILSNKDVNVYKGHLEESHNKPEGCYLS